MNRPSCFPSRWLLFFALVVAPSGLVAQDSDAGFPNRVLITNDNGIDDEKIVALARAFSEHAETWVVAPAEDRSGGGVHLTIVRTGSVTAMPRDLGPGIRAYAVDGYPGDAVFVALAGLMKDSLPDLVISGINGGPNLGGEWLYSGTVGAARLAALAGFPAIAVSGLLNDEEPGASEAAADWVVRFAGSQMVRELDPLEFLTVSFPPETPHGVRGVRVTDRAPLAVAPRLEAGEDNTFRLVGLDSTHVAGSPESDIVAWERGFISIVPMHVDEVDYARLRVWRQRGMVLPQWR